MKLDRKRIFTGLPAIAAVAVLAYLVWPSQPGPRVDGKALPAFADVAAERNLNHLMSTWGLSWNDYNGDNLPDLFTADHMHYPSHLYTNQGGLWFERYPGELGKAIGYDDHMGAWGDFDGDGVQDLYTTSGFYRPTHLLNFDEQGRFEDVTVQTGLAEGQVGSGRDALWSDFNGDGWLDLFTFNTNSADRLHVNLGNGKFEDRTWSSQTTNSFGKMGGLPGDLDNDGDIDLVIVTDFGYLVYMNRGDATFVERSIEAGFGQVRGGGSAALGDYDNDGDTDLYITHGAGDRLMQNDGSGRFVDVSEAAGVDLSGGGARSAGFADFDNDGWLDIYVVWGGEEDEIDNKPNSLYLNRGDGTFADITEQAKAAGMTVYDEWNSGKSLFAAYSDFNLDGFVDIAISGGGGSRQISGPLVLYQNQARTDPASGKCGNWVRIHTEKPTGSRDDLGARIRVLLPDGREIYRHAANGKRPLAQDAPGVHVGLACAPYIAQLSVTWPDGSSAVLYNVPVNDSVLVEAAERRYFLRSHPAALLQKLGGAGQLPLAEIEAELTAAAEVDTEALAAELEQRRNRVLAFAMVAEIANSVEIGDDELKSFYENNSERFTVPERFWIDRALVGVFNPRKRQKRLPWEVAKEVAEDIHDDPATEIAEELNIRAWAQTDRKVGRYWDIEGQTRGFTESGWFTPSMLEERFGADWARQIAQAEKGGVLGPIRKKEENVLHLPGETPFILEIVKVVEKSAARRIPFAERADDIRRYLRRNRIREKIDQIAGTVPQLRQGVKPAYDLIENLRYNVPMLAQAARIGGLHERADVASALAASDREARLDFALSGQVDEDRVSGLDIEDHVKRRASDWKQPDGFDVRVLFFAEEVDAEKAHKLLSDGVPVDQVQQQLGMTDKNTRKGRGASNVYERTLLLDKFTRERRFPEVKALEVGEFTEVIDRAGGHRIFILNRRVSGEPTDEDSMKSIARKEIQLLRGNELAARLAAIVTGSGPASQ